MATVSPAGPAEFARVARDLVEPGTRPEALVRLQQYLAGLAAHDLRLTVADLQLEDLPTVLQHYVAAAVEQEVRAKNIDAPAWTATVSPLDRPHFAWRLRSLRPHLMRITPLAFKRRSAFVDAAGVETDGGRQEPLKSYAIPARIDRLNQGLLDRGVQCEICGAGGSVSSLVFSADPTSRNVTSLFQPAPVLDEAATQVRSDLALEDDWLVETVRTCLAEGLSGSIELSNLRIFDAPPDYLLAMKCAALSVNRGPSDLDDIRSLLRFLAIPDGDAALEIVHRYFTDRQLLPDLSDTVEELLPR